MQKYTAIEHLKSVPSLASTDGATPIIASLSRHIQDKAYTGRSVLRLAKDGAFGAMFLSLILREDLDDLSMQEGVLDILAHAAIATRFGDPRLESYRGTPAQNRAVDRALWFRGHGDIIGAGAAHRMVVPDIALPDRVREVPIAVVGYGAAGIMIVRALENLGFQKITVFDKRSPLGIWSQPNVNRGSRNNPRDLYFDGEGLGAAPGNGDSVVRFLNGFARNTLVRKEVVASMVPGDLSHELRVRRGSTITSERYPIVVNAMGLGKPKPLHDPSRMRCDTPNAQAIRWQVASVTAQDAERKMHVFVGLGNSTAEMILQFQRLQDAGVDTDYRILTHYPEEAVRHPSDAVVRSGRAFRVFRDLGRVDLTGYQGDLVASRNAYYRALREGKIISGVSRWSATKRAVAYESRGRHEISFDRLFALIGYAHSAQNYRDMGCLYDEDLACARHDFDGEVIQDVSARGRDRIRPGYFSFGSVLETPYDPNAVVIPGMLFRLPDVLFGIIMRASEASIASA